MQLWLQAKYAPDCSEAMHVSLTMIRRHPQWVWKKNRYKVNFPPQVLAGSWIRISLPLQGFLGVFTSRTERLWAPWISGTNIKGEAKPGCISYHLFPLCLSLSLRFWTSPYVASEWRLSWHTVTAHSSTLINAHFILLSVMQCSCKWVFPLLFLCPSIPWRRLSCQNRSGLPHCSSMEAIMLRRSAWAPRYKCG